MGIKSYGKSYNSNALLIMELYAYKLFRLLKMTIINFIANPTCKYTPSKVDLTHIEGELQELKKWFESNINVCFGHDDIMDHGIHGTGNMLQDSSYGLHVCQMMGYSQINESNRFNN